MPTLNTTPNRAYQEPFLGNELSVDVGRIISALRAIDTDVAAAFAQIVAKAGLASPSFTGVPTTPTAAPGTDTGQIASTAFVRAAIVELIDSSPGALDTLNELAAALGDDPNFAATMAALIGTKADASALDLKEPKSVYAAKSSGYTAVAADNNAVIRFTATATLSLTAVATLGTNWHLTVVADGGDVTVDPNASETIDGATTIVIPNGYSALIVSNGSAFFTSKMWSIIQPKATMAFAQCRLSLSGANLILSRFSGQLLTINGVHYSIPSAGITLAPTALTPSTLYYIYAYMSGTTMTLEASATAYATDSNTGVVIKSGDATRTLVGMAYPETGPVFTDTAKKRFVRSWFNDPGVRLQNNFTANRATSSPHTTPQEVNSEIRCQFLLWSGEKVEAIAAGSFVNGNANGGQIAALGFNTTTTPEDVGVTAVIAAAEVSPFSVGALKEGLSEGFNYATLMGWVSASGGATFYGDINGRRTSLRCSLLR
ncbi:hypothetical protein [Rhizobium laguerreae]|uniref:hypothetical protein n=1 Tax=Rhizobium laguerreae TaxID=1076926 RepID=UPI001C925F14|nr:hypothetical protein [Rhizobium laguerreae]